MCRSSAAYDWNAGPPPVVPGNEFTVSATAIVFTQPQSGRARRGVFPPQASAGRVACSRPALAPAWLTSPRWVPEDAGLPAAPSSSSAGEQASASHPPRRRGAGASVTPKISFEVENAFRIILSKYGNPRFFEPQSTKTTFPYGLDCCSE